MNRNQFLRALRKYCKREARSFDWQSGEGKGSHGTAYVGEYKAVVKSGELTKDYVHVVLKQLDLDKDSL